MPIKSVKRQDEPPHRPWRIFLSLLRGNQESESKMCFRSLILSESGKIGCKKACIHALSQAQNIVGKGFILGPPKTVSKVYDKAGISHL